MFLLGHVGLTIALILLGLVMFKKTELIRKLDLRVIAAFALLPDMFDKIIGHVIFADTLNNGKLFAHTLLFLIIVAIVFIIVVRKNWWIYAFPVFTHLLLDQMWILPKTMLWPAFGWVFTKKDINVWEHWYQAFFQDPYILVGELVGQVVIIIIIIHFRLYIKDNFIEILKTGHLKG